MTWKNHKYYKRICCKKNIFVILFTALDSFYFTAFKCMHLKTPRPASSPYLYSALRNYMREKSGKEDR